LNILLFVFDILEENELIEKDDEGNYRLVRKIPAGSCRLRIPGAGLGNFDDDDLVTWEISSWMNISVDAQYEVVMDGTIVIEFSDEEIDNNLRGLDVDADSLDAFYSRFELKRLSALAVIEVVDSAGRISFEQLCKRLENYEFHSDMVERQVMITLEPGYLSALVAEMRKLGYLTGSQENIRLVRK